MNKKEIAEIRRQFTPERCSITRMAGCYVDGEKNKKFRFSQAFLPLPEEELFKYYEILKKSLSGSLGKNLLTLAFPAQSEAFQDQWEALRQSQLQSPELLEAFYDRIISSYAYVGNYLILLFHDIYDVPGRTSDGLDLEDASDQIFEYLLCSICPVELSKAGLSYQPLQGGFHNRIQDWVVAPLANALLYPAFHDRGADLHHLLYYCKNGEISQQAFLDALAGCPLPPSPMTQKAVFGEMLQDSLGEQCQLEQLKTLQEELNLLAKEPLEEGELPLTGPKQLCRILEKCGVDSQTRASFAKCYAENLDQDQPLVLSNITNSRTLEVRTPDVQVKVKPDMAHLIEQREIDGRACLVISLEGGVFVNGVQIQL